VSNAQRLILIGCSLTAVILSAGCSVRGESSKATVTPDDVFVVVTPTPGTPVVATLTAEIVTEYVVQPGDSLLGIAVRFEVTLDALQKANDIDNPNSIVAGQVLVIPAQED
jgi:LysM repeat protein